MRESAREIDREREKEIKCVCVCERERGGVWGGERREKDFPPTISRESREDRPNVMASDS